MPKKNRNPNRDLSQSEVIEKLSGCPQAQSAAYRVGGWIWATFTDKPTKEVRAFLVELGFHWNRKRNAWQHPCGRPSTRARSYDPRDKYVVEQLETGTAA